MDDESAPPGPVVTIFRSTLRPEAAEEYEHVAQRMIELARSMPGMTDYKTFESDDGERVTIVTFDSIEHHQAWRDHPEHRAAQSLGRDRFYAGYDIQVATGIRESHFRR